MVQQEAPPVRFDVTLLTDYDVQLFTEGNHFRLYEKLGAHTMSADGVDGTYFAVWAPNAHQVSVIGDFNGWDNSAHLLSHKDGVGIWEGFIAGVEQGAVYKYHIASRHDGYAVAKADPVAFYNEMPAATGSVVWESKATWGDEAWMAERRERIALDAPIAIYEVHLASWMRVPEDNNRSLSYRELGPRLAEYVANMGFTHVEFLPVMEHPFFASWGYQTTGFFAPTCRYGTPDDFQYLVDYLHQRGIGVILDWVPSHFPNDEHGLTYFDGTHLYEHADPRLGYHPDWHSSIFNYGRNEVRSFLLSSALFWLERFHIDGLRVDAVGSMLYLNYSREGGDWLPNKYGSHENLDAIYFLQRFNEEVYRNYPDVQTFAEESTIWPLVSRPTYEGGLGFGFRWDMGWMHHTLEYMGENPLFRAANHDQITFRQLYAYSENFVLPLSHDEVVHLKGSLFEKMPGDDWQRFANLRAMFSFMFASPGKKLLFMGDEFGQGREWDHNSSLDWHLLTYPGHEGVRRCVQDLLWLYRQEPALYELDADPSGFEWVDQNDAVQSVISFIRKGHSTSDEILVVCNFTPEPRHLYRVGVPRDGLWREVLNSDADIYGGSSHGNGGSAFATPVPYQGRPYSLELTLPPLGALFFKRDGGD